MPTLDWIGKSAVVNRHREVPYHLLRCDEKLSAGDADSGSVLAGRVLAALPAHNGPRVIYGEGSRLGRARLKREKITRKHIPYEIKVG